MKKYIVTEYELNALADLLNEIKDKSGSLLRPSEQAFNKAWSAVTNTAKRQIAEEV